MILVQISDTHIGDADELVYGQFDTAAALTSAVDYINNMVPTPDLVIHTCLLYTSPSPRDRQKSRMPSSA